jgi:hypothetical protein
MKLRRRPRRSRTGSLGLRLRVCESMRLHLRKMFLMSTMIIGRMLLSVCVSLDRPVVLGYVLILRQASCGAGYTQKPPRAHVCWLLRRQMPSKGQKSSILLLPTPRRRRRRRTWLRSTTLRQRFEMGGKATARFGQQTRQRRFWAGSIRRSSSLLFRSEAKMSEIYFCNKCKLWAPKRVCSRRYSELGFKCSCTSSSYTTLFHN